jgi:8-oxo-dGTP pyrophosphatase MutT (NUDIX family)
VHSPGDGPLPVMSLRARAVIPDTEGRVLLDRSHDPAKDGFYWFPGGGIEPGETAEEAVKRELVEEAAFQIDVLKPLYLSENLFVESGEYRHEVIVYFLAAVHARLESAPVDLRNHEWHPPSATPRPLLPPDVAAAVVFDLETGFKRPLQHFVCDERPAVRPA